MNSSGKITRSAPCPAAVARARRPFPALPVTSPRVGLSCASAMASRSAGAFMGEDVAMVPACGNRVRVLHAMQRHGASQTRVNALMAVDRGFGDPVTLLMVGHR